MEKQSVVSEKRLKTSINLKQSLRNAAIKRLIDLTGETEISKAVEIALLEWLERGRGGIQPRPDDSGPVSPTPKHLLQIAPNLPKMTTDQRRKLESAVWHILEAFGSETTATSVSAHDAGPGAKPGEVSRRHRRTEKPAQGKASGTRKQNGG